MAVKFRADDLGNLLQPGLREGRSGCSFAVRAAEFFAKQKGFNELLFVGKGIEFALAGLGTTDKRINKNPDYGRREK